MARYFADTAGRFLFPDELFPDFMGSSAVPDSPGSRAQALQTEHRLLQLSGALLPETAVSEQVFIWARTLLQIAELYGYFDAETILDAQEAIARIAEARNSNVTRYRGQACYIKGNWSLFGLFGVQVDVLKSRDLYKLAIQHGFARGWYRMGANAEARDDPRTALLRYETGAKLGDIACIYRLAMARMLGHLGMARNPALALRLFEQACDGCDADFPQPAFLLGQLMLGEMNAILGNLIPEASRDRTRGIKLLEKAACLGFSPAILRMAAIYQSDERGPNFMVALRYLHLAARQDRFAVHVGGHAALRGEPESQLVKWLLVGHPPVINKNEEWAYRFAAAGAELGNSTAQFAMGYMSEVGIACVSDRAVAIEHYRQSAKNGCTAASERLDGLAQDPLDYQQEEQQILQNNQMRLSQLQLQQPQQQQNPQQLQQQSSAGPRPLPVATGLRRTLTRQDHDRALKLHAQRLTGPRFSLQDVSRFAEQQDDGYDNQTLPPTTSSGSLASTLKTHIAPHSQSPEVVPPPASNRVSKHVLPYPSDEHIADACPSPSPYANLEKSLPQSPQNLPPPPRQTVVTRKPAPGRGIRTVSSPASSPALDSGSTFSSGTSSLNTRRDRWQNEPASNGNQYGQTKKPLSQPYQNIGMSNLHYPPRETSLSHSHRNFTQPNPIQPSLRPASPASNCPQHPIPVAKQKFGIIDTTPDTALTPPLVPGSNTLSSTPERSAPVLASGRHLPAPGNSPNSLSNLQSYDSGPRGRPTRGGWAPSNTISGSSTSRLPQPGRNSASAPANSPKLTGSSNSSVGSASPRISPASSNIQFLEKPRLPGVAYSFEEMGVKTVASDDGKCISM